MRYVSYKENSLLALDRQKPKNSYGFLGRRTVKIIFIDLTISPSAAILLYCKIAENVFCYGKESEETPATDRFPSSFHDVKTAVDGKHVESVNPSFYRRPLSSLILYLKFPHFFCESFYAVFVFAGEVVYFLHGVVYLLNSGSHFVHAVFDDCR